MIIAIILALMLGAAEIINKMVNLKATQKIGIYNGSLSNYIVASLLAAVIIFAMNGFRVDLSVFTGGRWYFYLGGTFGVIAFVLSMICLDKMPVFKSTTLLLIGQLAAGIILDSIFYHSFSVLKLIGVALVGGGIILDKKITG